jgi:hypothetical protein
MGLGKERKRFFDDVMTGIWLFEHPFFCVEKTHALSNCTAHACRQCFGNLESFGVSIR